MAGANNTSVREFRERACTKTKPLRLPDKDETGRSGANKHALPGEVKAGNVRFRGNKKARHAGLFQDGSSTHAMLLNPQLAGLGPSPRRKV